MWLLMEVYVARVEIVIFLHTSAPALPTLRPVAALVSLAPGLFLAHRAAGFVRKRVD